MDCVWEVCDVFYAVLYVCVVITVNVDVIKQLVIFCNDINCDLSCDIVVCRSS